MVQVVQLFEAGHTLRSQAASLLRQIPFVSLCLGSLQLLHLGLQVLHVGLKPFNSLC